MDLESIVQFIGFKTVKVMLLYFGFLSIWGFLFFIIYLGNKREK